MPSDDMTKAGQVLQSAFKAVMTERGQQHGGAKDSFTMIAEFWTVYLKHKHMHLHGIPLDLSITPADIAQMMSLLKKSRALYGDPAAVDNYVDDAGYTSVASQLADMTPEPGDPDFGSALRTMTRDQRAAYDERMKQIDKYEEELREGIEKINALLATPRPATRRPTPSEPIQPEPARDEDLMGKLANLTKNLAPSAKPKLEEVPSSGSE